MMVLLMDVRDLFRCLGSTHSGLQTLEIIPKNGRQMANSGALGLNSLGISRIKSRLWSYTIDQT